MSDVLILETARAAGLGGELSDEALQDALDEEEAWLARKLRGPLVGERTERFSLAYLRPRSSEVHLRRPTDAVVLSQDGTELDGAAVELRPGGWVVAQLPEGTRYSGILEATYTPNDELEISRALKRLVGLHLGDVGAGGMQAETMGTYSYQRGQGTSTKARLSILRDLREPATPHSLRVRSSAPGELAGLGR